METYLLDWAAMLLRWLHLIAGVAWIGASFYFVMLDSSLRKPEKPEDGERGVSGELWAVHGGGVYQSRKYLVGPRGEPLSEHLHWSKWEAYTTWLSGMGLMAVIYWVGAGTYLVDERVMALDSAGAIALSIAVLAGAWLVYDGLCRWLAGSDRLLATIILLLVIAASWGLFQLFAARAAYLHVGAMLGTIMAANVFFRIIPGQKRMVAEIRAGKEPDPMPGIVGKQRSVHNTYFTLPVLFAMISGHYPMTYGDDRGWLVLVLIMFAGVLIRQFFVQRHGGRASRLLPAVAVLLLVGVAWYLRPALPVDSAATVSDGQVMQIVERRCVGCHAAVPSQPGIAAAPQGLTLENIDQLLANVERIAVSVQSRYMPLGNLTAMTDEERALVAAWAQGKRQ